MSFISTKFVFLFSIIDSQIDILVISGTKLGKIFLKKIPVFF